MRDYLHPAGVGGSFSIQKFNSLLGLLPGDGTGAPPQYLKELETKT